jgi:ATP-dependent Clp protease ATP-binding subunit ClpC
VFERFTDRSRRAIVLAQEESRRLNHNYIGTEHILLGLMREGEGVGARALVSLGLSLEAVRTDVEAMIGTGAGTPSGHIPFTTRAKTVLEYALREALALDHNDIGTEHLVLGLVREGEGVAAQVLVHRGVELDRLRQAVLERLESPPTHEAGDVESVEWPEPVNEVATRLRAIEVILENVVERLDTIERRLPPTGTSG